MSGSTDTYVEPSGWFWRRMAMAGAWAHTVWILVPLTIILLLAWTPGISFTEDLGRHLLLGRIILETGSVPDTNLLTYTHPDFPFVNHHWLSEVVFYLIHRVGGINGLILLKMALMATAIGLAMTAVRPSSFSARYAAAGLMAAVILGFRSHIRPELFTYLGIGIYLFSFERVRKGSRTARWGIIFYALLWVNFHIYFIFGMGMAAAFAVEQVLCKRSQWTREAGWFLGLICISLMNPNGFSGVLYPLTIFDNYAVDLVENASPLELWRSVLNPMLLVFPAFSLLGVTALSHTLWAAVKKRDPAVLRPANAVIFLTSLAASLMMIRSTPLLALSGLPVVAAWIGSGQRRFRLYSRWLRHPVRVVVPALAIGLAAAIAGGGYYRIFPSPVGPTPVGFDDDNRYARITGLFRDHGLTGPVFTDFNIGSLVAYQIYPEPAYVDNRPEAFPGRFWTGEYEPAMMLGDAWERLCEKRRFNTVIVSLHGAREPFIQTLMRDDRWRLIHLDDLSAAWVRNTERNRPVIERLAFTADRLFAYERDIAERLLKLPDQPWWRRQVAADSLLNRLYSLVCIGEYRRVWPYVRQLHLMHPDYQAVDELMRVSAPPQFADAVGTVLEKKARFPLSAKQVMDRAGYLAANGRRAEAKQVLERGRIFFPLSPAIGDMQAHLEGMITGGNGTAGAQSALSGG